MASNIEEGWSLLQSRIVLSRLHSDGSGRAGGCGGTRLGAVGSRAVSFRFLVSLRHLLLVDDRYIANGRPVGSSPTCTKTYFPHEQTKLCHISIAGKNV